VGHPLSGADGGVRPRRDGAPFVAMAVSDHRTREDLPVVSNPIVVSVHEGDPLSRAGVSKFLEQRRGFVVLPDSPGNRLGRIGDVAVTLADPADPDALVRLRKLIIEMDRKVVLVADRLERPQLESVVDAGVHSVVWREDLSAATVSEAVAAVARGEGNAPADLVSILWTQLREVRREVKSATPLRVDFSERELSVMRLIADGLDSREIAAELSYSERTIKGLLHDLMSRLNFRNRAQAVAYAVREGYI
jgi:DNA-binding NarL/FixJ family response regulator